MDEIFKKQQELEDVLNFRYRWFNLFYNFLVAGLVIFLFILFALWGLRISTERKAADMTATARAAWEAELQAEADAEAQKLAEVKASQEYVESQEASTVAKALYGIRLFEEKYGYSEADLTTYVRCMFNRADATGNSLDAVIKQEGQFVGYADGNPVLDQYYNLAAKLVKQWHEEQTKPVDNSYQFAELTPDGIWLKNDLHADGYARRWHA